MAKRLRLSQSSTEMMEDILEEANNYGFDSINFELLLLGVLNAVEDDDGINPLSEYIFDECGGLDPESIENMINLAISEHSTKLEIGYVESVINQKKKNAEGTKTDDTEVSNDGNEESETDVTGENKEQTDKKDEGEQGDSKQESSVIQPDFVTNLDFIDCEGKKICIPANDDVCNVYEHLWDIAKKFRVKEVKPLHFINAMFRTDCKAFKTFFRRLNMSYNEAKKYFSKLIEGSAIPVELTGFVTSLNEKIDTSKPCEILMRDKEVDSLWNIMLKKNKRNAVIVGEAGVGKSALVEKITYDIKKKICPKEFIGFQVLSLDVNSLISGTAFRGDAEKRIEDLIAFLEKTDNIILFIDEVHTILGAGSCFPGGMDLSNALKPILARGDTIVIGATTNEEYERYFKSDAALSRRFERVEVNEPMVKDVYPMIKNKIAMLSAFHGVKIKKPMVEYAIMIASCFAFEKKNPDKTLDLIDRAMVTAKRESKQYVDKDCILKNFAIYFKLWENMSEESKKEVAYHEAGHYIVGKASGRLVQFNWLAVSIMPAENYLGVTVMEEDEDKTPYCDLNFYIDEMAFYLGGRVSENIFRGSFTSGAGADLDTVTRRAFQVVTKFGMVGDDFKNRIFLNYQEYPMFSEKATDIINEEVNKLIEKAFARAEKIIAENRDILEAIVDALLKKHIMSEKELGAIWQKVVRKRNK